MTSELPYGPHETTAQLAVLLLTAARAAEHRDRAPVDAHREIGT
jgi:hypothetical protein